MLIMSKVIFTIFVCSSFHIEFTYNIYFLNVFIINRSISYRRVIVKGNYLTFLILNRAVTYCR